MELRNNLHSFTLRADASALVDKVPDGQKSRRVSQAIIWYYTSPTFGGVPSPAELEDECAELASDNEKLYDTIRQLTEELNSRPMLKLKRWLTRSQS
jgi:hypothetical protein